MNDILEIELLDNDNTPIDIDIDFEGEFISGTTGEEYQKGYNEGHKKGYADGYSDGKNEGYSTGYNKGKTDGYSIGYNEGYTKGYNEGYDKGKEEGEAFQSQFWDSYQQNGQRTHYFGAFAGYGWNDNTFYPKYDIIATNAGYLFNYAQITDVSQRLKDCGVTLDTSKSASMGYIFGNTTCTNIPHISFASAIATQAYCFNGSNSLHTIEKLTLHRGLKYTAFLTGCSSLQNITIEGEIGNDISFANSSKLTTASVDSIINALIDLTGGTAQKLSLHPTVVANLTDEQWTKLDAKNWQIG